MHTPDFFLECLTITKLPGMDASKPYKFTPLKQLTYAIFSKPDLTQELNLKYSS